MHNGTVRAISQHTAGLDPASSTSVPLIIPLSDVQCAPYDAPEGQIVGPTRRSSSRKRPNLVVHKDCRSIALQAPGPQSTHLGSGREKLEEMLFLAYHGQTRS